MFSNFEQLTAEQIKTILVHIEKWKKISFSTKRLDREQAEKVVNSIYEMLGYKSPNVLFFDSPYAAYNFILGQTRQQLSRLLKELKISPDYALQKWYNEFTTKIYSQLDMTEIHRFLRQRGLTEQFAKLRQEIGRWEGFDLQFGHHIWNQFDNQSRDKIHQHLGGNFYRSTRPGLIIANGVCQLDYLVSIFNLSFNQQAWKRFKLLLQLGNHIFLREITCIICDRPLKMSFNSEGFLHADGEQAIQFADGTGLYSHHGKTLPIKYGKLHSKKWQTEWLLEERDSILRSALVEGLGYVRICSELSITEVDCWQNYLLIKVNINPDSKLIYLLRMNCYSGKIDCEMEIPYDLPTVQQAADSINWDIEPEEAEELEVPF